MGGRSVEDFDLAGVSQTDQEGRWEEIVSSTHADVRLRLASERPRGPFRGMVRRVWIDDLALVDATCDPCAGVRTTTRINSSDADFVAVLISRGGREIVSQDDASAELRSGDVVVWNSHRPIRFQVVEPIAKRSLLVPRTALDEIGARGMGVSAMILDKTAPATELLTSYLDVLARTVDRLPPAAAVAARNATIELLGAALQPGRASLVSTNGAPPLRTAIEDWIEHNLDRIDLSPPTIALAHNVSIRSVHRVFSGTGETVAGFIRMRRLARARQELTATDSPITEIAARWRFSDPSHFTRAFRSLYGVTPSHYRATPEAGIAVG